MIDSGHRLESGPLSSCPLSYCFEVNYVLASLSAWSYFCHPKLDFLLNVPELQSSRIWMERIDAVTTAL
jgi:hypothetical protein